MWYTIKVCVECPDDLAVVLGEHADCVLEGIVSEAIAEVVDYVAVQGVDVALCPFEHESSVDQDSI